jgi:hypothetical protein
MSHVAVARNDVARLSQNQVACLQLRGFDALKEIASVWHQERA